LNQSGINPVQNPYNFLRKLVPVKKTAIIGIGIAIVIAGIVGIYAVSTGGTAENPEDEEKVGLGDKAGGTVENQEDKEKIGLGDKAEGTAENPEDKEKIGLGDKAVGTAENP